MVAIHCQCGKFVQPQLWWIPLAVEALGQVGLGSVQSLATIDTPIPCFPRCTPVRMLDRRSQIFLNSNHQKCFQMICLYFLKSLKLYHSDHDALSSTVNITLTKMIYFFYRSVPILWDPQIIKHFLRHKNNDGWHQQFTVEANCLRTSYCLKADSFHM
jgi:hypothetical protein